MTTTTTTNTPQYFEETMTTSQEKTQILREIQTTEISFYFFVILALSVDYMGLCAIRFITERYNGKYKIKIEYE